eukprot:CAMPEP_0183589756 /NCGR_PEP_ID=MMETSP0371-20130417/163306_1 /TAXON_ID=268820 /ORGANISM="Peridinium aciculiferum, Strain PAER-2" /LENGTH=63 /DNA_ID=CAMNT_0025801091 /DNA_START=98 /DNA_END=286 /DNA_ORIENTATION=+
MGMVAIVLALLGSDFSVVDRRPPSYALSMPKGDPLKQASRAAAQALGNATLLVRRQLQMSLAV